MRIKKIKLKKKKIKELKLEKILKILLKIIQQKDWEKILIKQNVILKKDLFLILKIKY